jgi:general secretion pathway protein E/type IV pilus assembly protein PilB
MIPSDISLYLIQKINAQQAWHYGIIPFDENSKGLNLFIAKNLYSDERKNELELLFGRVCLYEIDNKEIDSALHLYYRKNTGEELQIRDFSKRLKDSNITESLLEEAQTLNASDIHIECDSSNGRIRFRIDGKLIDRYVLDTKFYPSLINKIKVRSGMDIAEKRLPQDGRISVETPENSFDVRVSSLPSIHSEKMVLRLLHKDTSLLDIHKLGMDDIQLEQYLEYLKKQHGIILISGPTGSGKSTTLYATLKLLNDPSVNILTVEDPVEFTLDGISQVQVKEDIGLDFARALKTFLRQDPDIIMLGEIRDKETAQMAVRAALTGHLVLSTIHTNSAVETINRLKDMDVPAFLISSVLNLSIAQRLIRKLCPDCKEEVSLNEVTLPSAWKVNTIPDKVYKASGCSNCHFTGYKGRKAIYEVLTIDPIISTEIRREGELSDLLSSRSYKSLANAAWELFCSGQTDAKEIFPILLNEASVED